MTTRSSDIADFYQQLGLLVRSNLPLPESLRQLGQNFPRPEFKFMLLKLGERVGKGEKLSQAIRTYPRFFDPIHIRLISAGEETGTLPETLFAVARFARFCQLIANRMRDIVAYPLLTIHLSLLTFLYVSITVIPKFQSIFSELVDINGLPLLTKVVLGTGMFIHDNRMVSMLAFLASASFSIWLFTPGITAHRMLMSIINFVPGSLKVVHSLDSARFCSLCSAFIRQRMPLNDAMETSAQLVDRVPLQQALRRVSQKIGSGRGISDALAAEKAVDPLVVLTFRSTPEGELPMALAQLGELFEHRVTLSVRSASQMWTVMSFALMTFVVGTVVIGMFLPLISVIRMMGE